MRATAIVSLSEKHDISHGTFNYLQSVLLDLNLDRILNQLNTQFFVTKHVAVASLLLEIT